MGGEPSANNSIALRIDTVGIVGECIDVLTQIPSYPRMAYNNTYGLQVISEAAYNAAIDNLPTCRTRIGNCRSLADTKDPGGVGKVDAVNAVCVDAYNYCMGGTITGGVAANGVSLRLALLWMLSQLLTLTPARRLRHHGHGSRVLPSQVRRRLSQLQGSPAGVGGALEHDWSLDGGVWRYVDKAAKCILQTESANTEAAFRSTGDFVLGKNLVALGNLLDQGVKVALVYGDRDYQCNCKSPLALLPVFLG